MKRVVKKTIATVLSSAMMFGTMLSGRCDTGICKCDCIGYIRHYI